MDLFRGYGYMFCNINAQIKISILSFLLFFTSHTYASDNYTKWETKVTTDSVGESRRVEITGNRKLIINGKSKDLTSKILDYKPEKKALGRLVSKRLLTRVGGAMTIVPILTALLKRNGYFFDQDRSAYVKNSDKWEWSCDGNAYTNPSSMFPCLEKNKKDLYEAGSNENLTVKVINHYINPENGLLDYEFSLTSQDGSSSIKTDSVVGSPNSNTSSEAITDNELGNIVLDEIQNSENLDTANSLAKLLVPNENESLSESTIFNDIDRKLKASEHDINSSQENSSDSKTNENESSFPTFCDWAEPVCSFINWFKDDSEIPNPHDLEISNFDTSKLPSSPQFNFDKQCPAPKVINLKLGFTSTQISVPFDAFCSFASSIHPFVILAAWLNACYIFLGYIRS